MRIENCPRCLARSATVSPLVQSAKWIRPAAGWGSSARERSGDAHPDRI